MPHQSYFEADRSVMADFLPERFERVLEVGCASGGFARHLGQAREVWGIEPDPAAAARARSRIGTVLEGAFDQVANRLPDAHFDLLICNDVIEHMPDHDAFLQQVRAKLRPGACLVGSLPNIRHVTALYKVLVRRDWPYAESGILDRTHLRFFTERSIRRMFREHGLQVERFEGIGSVIRHGLARRDNPLSPLASLAFRAGAAAVVVASLGAWHDTQYPQFGFRVRF